MESGCPYCAETLELLADKGVEVEQVSVDGRPLLRRWLEETTARRTVPQVFINGDGVGGCDEMFALDQRGELDERLLVKPSVDNPALRS